MPKAKPGTKGCRVHIPEDYKPMLEDYQDLFKEVHGARKPSIEAICLEALLFYMPAIAEKIAKFKSIVNAKKEITK